MTQKLKSPKDGADRQKEYRDRQRSLGRKPRLLYLTDDEKARVDAFLSELRASEP